MCRGQKVEEAGEEDGEVLDDKDKVQYDIEKLVEWPGFNSSLPAEFKDETNKYRAVNLSRTQLLKVQLMLALHSWIIKQDNNWV